MYNIGKMRTIVFVGRTNVGKSSLFNAVLRKRMAVVGAIENLTNDPIRFVAGDLTFFDTPGISKVEDLDIILPKVGDFDLVCIVVEPNMSIDLEKKVLAYFAKRKKECIFVLNKADLKRDFSVPSVESISVSAISGENLAIFRKRLGLFPKNLIKKTIEKETISEVKTGINSFSEFNKKIFIIGRSNVGKSSIGNYLLQKDRFKVMDEIGTTRDLISEDFGSFELFDTPGYRKNNALDAVEKASQYRLDKLIEENESGYALMVIDASIGLTKGDRILLDRLLEKFAVLICVNKIDVVEIFWLRDVVKEIKRIYDGIEVVEISAKTGQGMDWLRFAARKLSLTKFPKPKTAALNKWLGMQGFSCAKYIVQRGPLDFILFSKKNLTSNHVKFLEKSLLDYLKLKGVRIKIEVAIE